MQTFISAGLSVALTLAVAATAFGQAPKAGIGVQLYPDAGNLKIMAVTPGGPAERAGLKVGDLIMAVDDRPVAFMDPAAAVAAITGAPGSQVRLTLVAGKSSRTIAIVRGAITQVGEVRPPAPSPNGPQRTPQAVVPPPLPAPATQAPRATPPALPAATQPVATGVAPVALATWVEPRERAFSVSAPKGWPLSGGINWLGPIDAQAFLQVQSPDGRVKILIGDPTALARMVPNAFSTMQTGAREGGTFRMANGGLGLLQRFMTGAQFAKLQVTQRVCQNAQWLREESLPELSQRTTAELAPELRRMGGTGQASAGEVGFACPDGTIGYATATTILAQGNGPTQSWGMLRVGIFTSSDPKQTWVARWVLESMLGSFKMDPGWQSAYDQKVWQATGAAMRTQNAFVQGVLQSARNANDTLARMNHPNEGVARSRTASPRDMVTGKRDVCDAIGRCGTVSTDHESVWMDHSGRIVPGRAGGAPPDNTGVWAEMK